MKIIVACLLATLFSTECFCQLLDQSISQISNDIAQKVSKKNKVKLALTDFVNGEGTTDALTNYIREEMESKLINADDLQVMDRKHIKLLLFEHKLQSEGLIDESTAKSAISFIKVDGWVVAQVTSIGDGIKIKVTVTDVTTSLMYASAESGLISDIAIKNLLEKLCTECGGRGTVQLQTRCAICEGAGSYVCQDCKGLGRGTGLSSGIKCDVCHGDGKMSCKACNGNGRIVSNKICVKCNGKVPLNYGNIQASQKKTEICTACNGNGKLREESNCSKCVGTGQLLIRFELRQCPDCSGRGQIVSFIACSKCDGKGKLQL